MASEVDAARYVGLDVGGTFLKAGLVDAAGTVLERRREPIAGHDGQALLAQLEAVTRSFGSTPRAVGVGLPGFIDRRTGVLHGVPNLRALEGVALGRELSDRLGVPTAADNDANAAALAEAWQGAGRGADSVLMLTLGTGVGAGLVLGGRVWTGRSGYAGEFGHLQVKRDGQPCGCGSWGCLETEVGAAGWVRRADAARDAAGGRTALAGLELDPEQIVAAAVAGDAVALSVVDESAEWLGLAIAFALDLLNLEKVVIGGGVAAAGDFLLGRIREQARRRTFPQIFADAEIAPAALGGDAGVVGAARLAMLALGA
ncbi:MAG: ROK family protein [Vicinamibacteria bacterium]|nr:ROK family protein [Vicinamibacteria bacterium]